MNLATRILGVAIFVSLLAGATYGAFQAFEPEAEFSSVELQEPGQVPSLLAGQRAPLSLGAENLGEHDTNITLAAETDGFTFQTNPSVTTVPAGNSTRINGLIQADSDLEGDHNVTLVANENETGDRLDTVSFSVSVTPPSPPEVSLEPVLPAVIPGQDARFHAQLQNTVDAPQRVNVSLVDGTGTVDPERVSLRPGSSGSTTVTAEVPEDASGTHEVAIEAVNEAGQTAQASSSVSVVSEGEIVAEPLRSSYTVDKGNEFTVPIVVVSNTDTSGEITATGEHVVAANFSTLQPRSSSGGFVTLEVPEGAADSLDPSIELQIGDRTQTVSLSVSTTPTGENPTQGQQAKLEYVGRLANGSGVFGTSIPGVAEGPFEKSQHFQSGRQQDTMTVRIGAMRQRAPSGVVHAVENMTEGESVTVTLEPEEAFGPERRTEELQATSEVQRNQEVPREIKDVPKNRLPPEFDIENKSEGDVIEFETSAGDVPITLRFRVVELTDKTVTLERLAEEGETITFYAPWPNATEVTKVNETTIVYTTTPPDSASEEPFAWDANPNSHQAQWGNTTLVESVNETAILLRHQPEEGLEYTAATGRFGQERSYRVEEVGNETIVVSTPNQNPLGGETVTFDLTLEEISQAQQRRRPPGLGGR